MLDDLIVIEIGQILAGPYAGAILADLGATVIKVEKPDGGDDGRRMGVPYLDDDSLTFHEFNRGKRSVSLDLKSAEGIRDLHDLADRADVLIHNLRPDVPPALGITAADGDVMICVGNDRLFAKFCTVLGHPEWIADPLFATNRSRLTNRDTLVPQIAAAIAQRVRSAWCELFGAAGVPCAPVNTLRESVSLEQFSASEMLGPPLAGGAMQLIGLPISFDGIRRHANHIAPKLGADNARFITAHT